MHGLDAFAEKPCTNHVWIFSKGCGVMEAKGSLLGPPFQVIDPLNNEALPSDDSPYSASRYKGLYFWLYFCGLGAGGSSLLGGRGLNRVVSACVGCEDLRRLRPVRCNQILLLVVSFRTSDYLL